MEPNSPKKIQFSVPLFQSQLDPQAAEHIRKRRPTPATLVIYNDPNTADDKQTPSGQGEQQAHGTQLSPAQRKQSVYTPPTMRELQLVVEQHFQRQEQRQEAGLADSPETPSPITAQRYGNSAAAPPWANHNCPEPNGNDTRVSQPLGTQGGPGGSTAAGGREQESDSHGARGEEDRDTPHPHPHPHPIVPSLSRQGLSHLDTLSEFEEPSAVGTPPRRKDTPYQHQPPFTPGVKQMKTQTQAEPPFPEEEETQSDQEEGVPK